MDRMAKTRTLMSTDDFKDMVLIVVMQQRAKGGYP